MKKIKYFSAVLVLIMLPFLVSCGRILNAGATYTAKNGNLTIVVDALNANRWTLKNNSLDDSSYVELSVNETDETIGDYPIIKLVAEKVSGDIDFEVATSSGKEYIYTKYDGKIYMAIAKYTHTGEIIEDISQAEESSGLKEYIIENPSLIIIKQ